MPSATRKRRGSARKIEFCKIEMLLGKAEGPSGKIEVGANTKAVPKIGTAFVF
jgi:hypothetical protein